MNGTHRCDYCDDRVYAICPECGAEYCIIHYNENNGCCDCIELDIPLEII